MHALGIPATRGATRCVVMRQGEARQAAEEERVRTSLFIMLIQVGKELTL